MPIVTNGTIINVAPQTNPVTPGTPDNSILAMLEEEKLKKLIDQYSDTNLWREKLLGSVQGRFDSLYAYTEDTTSLIATTYTNAENNIFVKSSGRPVISAKQHIFEPEKSSGIFSASQRDTLTRYKNVTIDVETQRLLRSAGVDTLNGTEIPENPTKPLKTGARQIDPNIHDTGVFSEIQPTPNNPDLRYIVTARSPDSFNYHFELNRNDDSIPIEQKGHAQYQRTVSMTDSEFETELAKARYLSGMEPYLDAVSAKEFDHFTYWRYKQPNSNNAFQGAFVHIFISRPDLHLFDRSKSGMELRSDVLSIPELASIIYTHPECAESLVQRWQTKAMTDINIFLSNRACGIQLSNDQIDDHQFVEGFTRIKPTFGGRMDNPEGDIDVTFNETQDLSVSNTILLWMKYIHATYTGDLSPLVNETAKSRHQFTRNIWHNNPLWRRLDSLASIYIIVTDMTQRNIIFWRKYFGVYPKATAFAGLSQDGAGRIVEGVRKISIPFKYTTFRSNNIVDLYAFNRLSNLRQTLGDSIGVFADNVYQTWDQNSVNEHDNISGLPFVAIEQHINTSFLDYNRRIAEKMYNPQLLFTRSDGAFIPANYEDFQKNFVAKYWGGLGERARTIPITNVNEVTQFSKQPTY